jgi:hypothetical protein
MKRPIFIRDNGQPAQVRRGRDARTLKKAA